MAAGKQKRSKLRRAPAAGAVARHEVDCPIAAVGASAGGLEAFEKFFHHLPPDSGIAFVLVPHLDPEHGSILTEILQRATAMPVVESRDRMVVTPNRVYVIPPNRDMAVFRGRLRLSLPEMPRGHRMPIDYFMRSLAEEHREKSIGVILSGSGTDGTLGLRAIHGAGGVSFVQDPVTAKYDGMPGSAIHSGVATYVLPVEEIPARLVSCAQAMQRGAARPAPSARAISGGLDRILMILRSGTGHDFALYKKTTISRRIERRMVAQGIETTDDYARYLKENPGEVKLLFKELLITVTSFFRDPEAFVALKETVLPRLFEGKPESHGFRIWVPGCATGEEAYSIAMLFRESLDETGAQFRVQIYGTDLDEGAITTARSGLYPPNITLDVPPGRVRRFFQKEGASYKVRKEIREMIIFAVQDVIKDPPFTRLNLVSCRNLLIYLEPALQHRILAAFHYALRPEGYLFLSPSETVGTDTELFSPANRKWKLYRVSLSGAATRALQAGALPWTAGRGERGQVDVPRPSQEANLAELTRSALLKRFAPASVVTDEEGNILYVHGDSGRYLRPAPGKASLNVIEMARSGLQRELRSALRKVTTIRDREVSRKLVLRSQDGTERLDLEVRRLTELNERPGMLLVSFREEQSRARGVRARTKPAAGRGEKTRVTELEEEVSRVQESLQATIEEQQASNEELKSTNEELQSTNEELQSTNEEMETSKEELQSVNEELATVNAELQSKIEQLVAMQDDMKNLLDNSNIGTIFLDARLAIKRFNRDVTRIFRLVDTDVGRPLADIKPNIKEANLLDEAEVVLESLQPRELEVESTEHEWYMVRITPYRTVYNVIDGVVLTFTDITKRKLAEIALHDSSAYAMGVVETIREPLLVLDGELRVVAASRSFYRIFFTSSEETLGRHLYELGDAQWNSLRLRELLERILPQNTSFEGLEVEAGFPVVGRKRIMLNARRILGREGQTKLILLALEDITERTTTEIGQPGS